MQDDSDNFDALPPDLRDAMRAEYPVPVVPAALDERILGQARSHLLSRRRPPRFMRLFGSVAAAAAAVVIVGVAVHIARLQPAPSIAANDRNHDGAFNILDALAAAQGGASPQDVDRLARAVVRVETVQ